MGGIVNMLWAGQSRVSILLEVIDFYILHNIQTSSMVHAISYSVCNGALSWG